MVRPATRQSPRASISRSANTSCATTTARASTTPTTTPPTSAGRPRPDVSWASNTNALSLPRPVALRTNQINVYLDANIAGTNGTVGSAPLHKTIDGTQYLAGSNLIRPMRLFADLDRAQRAGEGDDAGLLLAELRRPTAPTTATADSSTTSASARRPARERCRTISRPSGWPPITAARTRSCSRTRSTSPPIRRPTISGAAGTGIRVSASDRACRSSRAGPLQLPYGWSTGSINQVDYILQGAEQGTQYIALDGYNSSGSGTTNRAVSRPFLLDPGYYQVGYHYISDETFYFNYSTYCTYKPASGSVWALPGGTTQSNTRFIQPGLTANGLTDIIGVFFANGQLISTPARQPGHWRRSPTS